jgi:branched-chain amino acid transport system ATP-binding protein
MLLVEGLSAGYGLVPVLDRVSLRVGDKEVVALLGRNGVGKTTLLRTIMGLLPATAGKVEFSGETMTHLPPHTIARLGIAYVPQGRGILPKLTVEENLIVGTRGQTNRRLRSVPEHVFHYFPILKNRLGQLAGTLSGGEQQQLALGRALCARPRLMLLDEPSEGLQPTIVQFIAELIPEFVRNGMAVLLVEQNLDLVLAASARCIIMEKGRIVHECSTNKLAESDIMSEFLVV